MRFTLYLNFLTTFLMSMFSLSAKKLKIRNPKYYFLPSKKRILKNNGLLVTTMSWVAGLKVALNLRKISYFFSGSTNTIGGGFSSIRTISNDYDLKEKSGLHIRYKGMEEPTNRGSCGRKVSGLPPNFTTGNGWQEAMIPFDNMDVSWRGRPLSKAEHPLIKSKIRSIEFMIYDKKDGPFKLQIDWIKSY